MPKKIISILLLVFINVAALSQINIIPAPAEIIMPAAAGSFALSGSTKIIAPAKALQNSAQFLQDYVQRYYGFALQQQDNGSSGNSIRFEIGKKAAAAPGSYSLQVTRNGIQLQASDETGIFYGVQSLIQLLPVPAGNSQQSALSTFSVPFVRIKDQPRFAYRGMHLDVSRHFFPVAFVKRYIDYLALHKMNYFHWHLTDDQGWRIEIKKYPGLTRVGAYRDGTIIDHHPGTGNDNTPYGGYYTQDEIKEVIQYAARRYITIIPEIEMPGHASAAIAAVPSLSCFPQEETVIPTHPSEGSKKKKGKKVQETWGVFDDVFCAGKDSTFTFLQNVVDEVMTLFPSKFLHIGGDESPKANWKRCHHCQARMKQNNLKDEHELQSYFVQRMEKYINAKGRTIIGWDEILEGGLAPNAVVMSWRGEEGGIAAAKDNHYVIMTPGSHVYFDHSQTGKDDSLTFGGYTTVQKVYSYEPLPKEIPAEKTKYVLGAQANVWSEYIHYPSKVEYQVFPRMSALSEVLWSPKEKRNWQNFEPRLQLQFKRYDLWKTNYSKAFFDPQSTVPPKN